MADGHDPAKPTLPALNEAKRLVATAEGHERRVTLRKDSARFLDERGEHEQAAIERREADLERDAARTAWDRAMALQGPTQTTEAGLEIPVPSRDDFIANLRKIASPADAPNEELSRLGEARQHNHNYSE
jgi:hypothetical protein